MPARSNAAREAEFTAALRTQVLDLDVEDPEIRDVRVTQTLSALDEPIWKVTLLLSPPRGEEWNTDHLRMLRQQVRSLAATLADSMDVDLDGLPVIEIAAFDPPLMDTAPADLPEPGEDPLRRATSTEDEIATFARWFTHSGLRAAANYSNRYDPVHYPGVARTDTMAS